MPSSIKLHIWGDHACFTRPEMKAERVSYDVITPSAAALVNYGLDAADATLLAKELADYEAIIANPSAAISRRRALTVTLRPQFRAVSELLAKMDRHVLRFRRTEAGAAFAAVWDTSRIVRDLGTSATPAPAKPTA